MAHIRSLCTPRLAKDQYLIFKYRIHSIRLVICKDVVTDIDC